MLDRAKGVGVLTREQAINYSTAGPVLRASGVAYDIRRAAPYSIYDRFEFDVITGKNGDLYDRYYVRLLEMRESVRILKQAVARHPRAGRSCPARRATRSRCPPARRIRGSRTPRASWAITWSPTAPPTAYRYHVRSPSFINLTALETMCLGHTVADVVGILGQPRYRAGRGGSVDGSAWTESGTVDVLQ